MLEKKYRIISIVSISILEAIIIYLLYSLCEYMYPYIGHIISVITSISFFFFIDLVVVFISLMIYLCHLLKPIKKLTVQTNLAIIKMVLGVMIAFFPLLATILFSLSIYALYIDGFLIFYFMAITVNFLFLVPGLILFLSGWKDRKMIKSSHSEINDKRKL